MKAEGACMAGGPLNGGSKPTHTPEPTRPVPSKAAPKPAKAKPSKETR